MIPLLIVIGLLLGSALFSSSELAIMGVPKYVVLKYIHDAPNSKWAKRLLQLKEKPERTLITVLVGNNLVNVALSVYAAELGDSVLSNVAMTGATAFLLISVTITFLILLFGEIIPKVFATKYALRFSLYVTPLILGVHFILFPIVFLLERLILGLNTILGKSEEHVSKQVVDLFVEDGKKQGIFSHTEALIIHNFLEFGERNVESVFRHRTDLFALSEDVLLSDAVEKILKHPFSRIPIYKGDKDHIVGLMTIRDALHLYHNSKNHDKPLKEFGLRDIARVPITASIFDVFLDMKKYGWHLALVIDEYGGTAGIVTFEDILEDLVGAIRDESDNREEGDIVKVDDHVLTVKGDVILRDIIDVLHIEGRRLPADLENEVSEEDTISYIILHIFKDFAKKGDILDIGDIHVEVTSVNKQGDKIEKVTVYWNKDAEEIDK